jgi:arylsulfatase A-like enzyme
LLFLLIGTVTACSEPAPLEGSNIIIVLIDTMRSDYLDTYGGNRNLSPFMDRLAQEGICFRRVMAPSSWTKPSVASLLTGLYPGRHGAVRYPWHEEVVGYQGMIPLHESHVTLAERMKASGYRTAAFVTNPHVIASNRFDQGFDAFHQPAGDAAALLDRALEWIETEGGKGKFFLYLHLIDPHSPYYPPDDFRNRLAGEGPGNKAPFAHQGDPMGVAMWVEQRLKWRPENPDEPFRFDYGKIVPRLKEHYPDLEAQIDLEKVRALIDLDFECKDDPALRKRVDHLLSLYEGEVAYVDDALARFVDALEELRVLDRTILALTGDHGEAFLEHDIWGHGFDVHREQVDVPLILRVPEGEGTMRGTFDFPVSLVDLYPTLLDMIGEPIPGGVDGASLWPAMSEGNPSGLEARCVFAEALLEYGDFVAARSRDKKLIRTQRPDDSVTWDYYDLSRDPGEQEPLPVDAGDEAQRLKRSIEVLLENRDRRFEDEGGEAILSEDEIEQMKKLGYL